MTHPRPFRFGVLASKARSSSEWTETAKKAESLGYSTLVMPDHFGDQLSPIAALSTAAAVTDTLRVGSLVFANDFRHPAVLAKEAATLDLLSDGRLEVGVGAGWMTKDYTWTGITQDRAGVRIDRMIEAIAVLRGPLGRRRLLVRRRALHDHRDERPAQARAGGRAADRRRWRLQASAVDGGAVWPTSSASTPTSARASSVPRRSRRCRPTPPTRSSAGSARRPAIDSTTSRSASSSSSPSSPTTATPWPPSSEARWAWTRRRCSRARTRWSVRPSSSSTNWSSNASGGRGRTSPCSPTCFEAFAPVVAALAGT